MCSVSGAESVKNPNKINPFPVSLSVFLCFSLPFPLYLSLMTLASVLIRESRV